MGTEALQPIQEAASGILDREFSGTSWAGKEPRFQERLLIWAGKFQGFRRGRLEVPQSESVRESLPVEDWNETELRK